MPTGAESPVTSDSIALEGELTIYTAADTCARLRGLIGGRTDCTLDLTAVTEIDGAGLQLVLWLQRAAASQGALFRIEGVSQPVAEVIELLQLHGQLGIEPDAVFEEGADESR